MHLTIAALASAALLVARCTATISLGIRNLPDAHNGQKLGRNPTSTFVWFDGEFPCGGPSLGVITSDGTDFCAPGRFTLHNRIFSVEGCDGGDDVRQGFSNNLQVFEFIDDGTGTGNLVKTLNSFCEPQASVRFQNDSFVC
jgi:hypothetical protein